MITAQLHKELDSTGQKMELAIELAIQKGEFITLYGPSGSGKTSTLRMLAGLLVADRGSIQVDTEVWFDTEKKICRKPQERRLGYVFQEYALFPNMTVRKNLVYALEKTQDAAIIDELIEIVELGNVQERKPASLSGGQQQRVALARALVRKPNVLLLDEPLSALDIAMRTKLQEYIVRLHKEYQLTTIMVSHDIGEIVKMSDRMYCIENGRVVQSGTPLTIFGNTKVSGKFQLIGEILAIQPQGVVYIVTVLIVNNVIKVIAQASEISDMSIGDTVMVASKAFNPMLIKI